MEKTKSEIDSLHSDKSIALLSFAGDRHVIQGEMFKFLERPGCEHEPRYNGIDKEDYGIGDSSGHATRLLVVAYEYEN